MPRFTVRKVANDATPAARAALVAEVPPLEDGAVQSPDLQQRTQRLHEAVGTPALQAADYMAAQALVRVRGQVARLDGAARALPQEGPAVVGPGASRMHDILTQQVAQALTVSPPATRISPLARHEEPDEDAGQEATNAEKKKRRQNVYYSEAETEFLRDEVTRYIKVVGCATSRTDA